MDLLHTFGITWVAFISQVIIILVVYFILKKYAFGPVTDILEQRRKRIADGEANLEKIRTELEQAEAKVAGMLSDANKDAERLIEEAKTSAASVREQKTQDAITEAGNIIAKAKEASKLEHERLLADLKRDFGRLVIDTTGKVTGKVLDDSDQERINQEAAGQISV
jgi:F-type H+-transporting ATPase subunit b